MCADVHVNVCVKEAVNISALIHGISNLQDTLMIHQKFDNIN